MTESTAADLIRSPRSDAGSVRAWDLPTRLFKWSLVILVITAWIASGFNDPNMTVHKAAGYGILVLLVYRVLWGVFGSRTARFSTFVRSPKTVLAYLRGALTGKGRPYLGHNPAGGWMILGLLAACAVQVVLGLFASDGVSASGPLAGLVSDNLASTMGEIHGVWFYVILALAVVHIAINLFYQFVKRENLIGAMVTGRKPAARYADAPRNQGGSLWVAAACLVVAFGLVYVGIVSLGGSFFAS